MQRVLTYVVFAGLTLGATTGTARALDVQRASSEVQAKAPVAADDDELTSALAPDCSSKGLRCVDGAVVRVDANTELEVLRKIPLQLGPPGTPMVLGRELRLKAGKIEIDMVSGQSSAAVTPLLIRTQAGPSAIIERGHGVVMLSGDSVTIAASEGRMFTAIKERWYPLREGRAITYSPSSPWGAERELVKAPTLLRPKSILFVERDSGKRPMIELRRVDGAVRYQISIVSTKDTKPELVTRFETSSPIVPTPQLAPGRYKVRARAIDRDGLMSQTSEPTTMHVLWYKAPGGDTLDDGVLRIARDERVELWGAEKLQVSYGTATHFVNVPSSIGLDRGRALLARFRPQTGGPETRIQLQPSDVGVEVELAPSRARWPKDRVTVAIRVREEPGAPRTSTPEIRPELTINAEPVQVDWQARGNLITAEVPTPKDNGPWVVRVVVKNQLGAVVGFGFLEVADAEERQ